MRKSEKVLRELSKSINTRLYENSSRYLDYFNDKEVMAMLIEKDVNDVIASYFIDEICEVWYSNKLHSYNGDDFEDTDDTKNFQILFTYPIIPSRIEIMLELNKDGVDDVS